MEAVKIKMIPRSAVDLLYPRRCPVCHDIAPVGRDICPDCREALPYVREPRCRKCGKPVEETEVFCGDCMKYPRSFDEGSSAFIYDDRMRETIRFFKNKGRREYGSVLGRLLLEACREELERWKPDLIVPVPLHRSKLRKRGYNQAEIVAGELSKRSGIKMRGGALTRLKATRAMRQLDASERRKNLTGAFAVNREELLLKGSGRGEKLRNGGTGDAGTSADDSGKCAGRVLLIDDIFTTGSTMDASAAALKSAGVKEVFFLTVCTGAGASAIY